MKRVALLGVLVVAVLGCKSKKSETETQPGSGTGTGTGTGTGADAAADAAGSGTGTGTGTGAAQPPGAASPPAPPMPSVALVAALPTGPMRSADGRRVTWCTRGDNGMAEWAEVVCTVIPIGSKPSAFTVLSYADAMAVDEGVDPAGDADAGVRAASARDRVAATIAKVENETHDDLVAMPAPVRCSFQGGEFVSRSDDQAGTATGCDVGGVTAHISAPGKVTLASADKSLFAEVFKARARGKGEGGDACFLEASSVELSVDAGTKTVALAIALSNPSDACALVTEYEVRALRLP